MLRITTLAETSAELTLKLEGALASEWVTELERECRRALAQRQRVALDFKDVTSVDRRAARVLAELTAENVAIVNCPPIVRELLERSDPD